MKRERRRNARSRQVGADHHVSSRKPIDHETGDRREQQHREDLEHDRAAHAHAGAGQAQHEDDEGHGVEGVARARQGMRGEERPEPPAFAKER